MRPLAMAPRRVAGLTHRSPCFVAVVALAAAAAWWVRDIPAAPGGARWSVQQFFSETGTRPDVVWINREDVIYHDLQWPAAVEVTPEFWAFGRRAWVFNRAMQWQRDEPSGTILCCCPVGELALTGEKQVSAWHTGPANALEHQADYTVFRKRSPLHRDCAVLPALQFHLGQHRLNIQFIGDDILQDIILIGSAQAAVFHGVIQVG